MNIVRKLRFLLFAVLLATSACNLPQSPPATSAADESGLAATVAAQVTEALYKTATPVPSQTPLPPTATASATATITPTYSPPILKINENSNCRSGPGESYAVLVVLKAGQSVDIVGRGPQDNYWVVKIPGRTETCWVWGEFATVSGSAQTLAEITPPPTITAAPPAAPRGLTYTFVCSFTDVTVNLGWTDLASDESGYRILRNGGPLAELPANSSFYTDVAAAASGSSFTYSIEAFNIAGKSSPISISFACP
ncbi:MAG: SH3 domain-containing protein [Anaerolineales bacterium]|jgi:hypothetical protein|nr:SH3 domain-containing protein [Anaerolineales bacterium]